MAKSSLNYDEAGDELAEADDGALVLDAETMVVDLIIERDGVEHHYRWNPETQLFEPVDPDDDDDDETKASKRMAQQQIRKRMVIDLLVDPGTASPRVMNALNADAVEFLQVLRVKDRGITITELSDHSDVHDHVSRPGEACAYCVQILAMDERS